MLREKIERLWRLLPILLIAPSLCAAAAAQIAPKDYQVKAAFLFNFTQFVAWPAEAFADPHAPFVIGVVGNDPFGSFLDETIRGEEIEGRPLVIRRFRHVEGDVENCQLLFIGQSEAADVDRILLQLKDHMVLTVSDVDNFTRRGGMVGFVNERDRVRLRINVEAARNARLTISSKLLRVAEIVGTQEAGP